MATSLVRHWGEWRRPRSRWPRRIALLAAAAAAAGIGVGAWLGLRPHAWRPPSGDSSFTSCTYGGYVRAWCADVAVPEEPGRRSGPSLDLHVAVLPATRQPAAGALFYLEGGPGGAATAAAIQVNALFAQVGRTRDLVMIDQRGTGGSSAVDCPAAGVRARDSAAVAAYVRRCVAHAGAAIRLDTTVVAAADLEAVRRALGYGRVDLYGASYGATLAQAYLRAYPRSVRSVVLDSGSLPNVRVFDASARNAEHALDQIFSRCARAAACHRAYPAPRRELAVLLARRSRRVTVPSGTYDLGPAEVAWTVQSLSTSPDGASTIPYELDEAVRGDYVPLADSYGSLVGPNLAPPSELAMYWVILCSEPWASFDAAATARAGAGSYLRAAAVARARLFTRACRSVPRGRVAPGSTSVVPSRVPALLLAGGADPLDPPADLTGWRRAFPNGRLVVVPGGGHGSMSSMCVQMLVARFVAAGSTRTLDTSCVDHISLPSFQTR